VSRKDKELAFDTSRKDLIKEIESMDEDIEIYFMILSEEGASVIRTHDAWHLFAVGGCNGWDFTDTFFKSNIDELVDTALSWT